MVCKQSLSETKPLIGQDHCRRVSGFPAQRGCLCKYKEFLKVKANVCLEALRRRASDESTQREYPATSIRRGSPMHPHNVAPLKSSPKILKPESRSFAFNVLFRRRASKAALRRRASSPSDAELVDGRLKCWFSNQNSRFPKNSECCWKRGERW